MDEFVFAVEVEIAWGRVGGDFTAFFGATAGFEGDERCCCHGVDEDVFVTEK